eukprot:1040131-Prorocentrum_lima.AAC.1
MTSSLVGSEMCIRDSFHAGVKERQRNGCHRPHCFSSSNRGRADLHPSKPVSYTHLTLPTICSV